MSNENTNENVDSENVTEEIKPEEIKPEKTVPYAKHVWFEILHKKTLQDIMEVLTAVYGISSLNVRVASIHFEYEDNILRVK